MSKFDILDLASKKEPFTPEELAFVKSKYPKKGFKAMYAIYAKESSKGLYVCFIIDYMPYGRRSLAENQWDIKHTRELTNQEYHDEMQNFGCNNRRFHVWYYESIEKLIEADKRVGASPPPEFVELCKKLGYSKPVQLELNL